MIRRAAATIAFVALTVSLAGCGLRPIYSNGARGTAAQALAAVQVEPIEGRAGWLVQNAIKDRPQTGLLQQRREG